MEVINELTEIIQQEADLAESMDALLKEKQNSFIYWKPDELALIVQEEEQFLRSISELEKIRIGLVARCSTHGKEKKLMEIADEYDDRDLRTQSQRLHSASERVMKKNNQNKQLLQNSLSFVKNTLALLTNNYQRQLIDQKA